ncbi:MAG: dephospho-CoA kinase [Candidatus Diapherotrites archaeon]
MLVVGLTGGIASGKTLAGEELQRLGAELIDCDKIVRALYEKENVRKKLITEFGKETASERGTINRKKLAAIVFSDPEKLKKLNSIVHPLVFAEVGKRIKKLNGENFEGIVVVEAAVLLESGMQESFDRVIAVNSPKEKRLERLISRGLSKEEANERISSQKSDGERVKLADYLIDNDKGVNKLITETKKIYNKLEEFL